MIFSSPLEELAASEAAIRGMDILKNRKFFLPSPDKAVEYSVVNPDQGDSREEVATQLFNAFIHIYDYQFQDSSQHSKIVQGKVCNTRQLDAAERSALRGVFTRFVEEHYDEHGGLTLTRDRIPHALQELYEYISGEKIKLHRAGVALGTLLVELGRGEKWKQVLPEGIDFTRGAPGDDLPARFREACFGQTPVSPSSTFIHPPESTVTIAGMKFPAKKDITGWRTHLLTPAGHLVDMTTEGPEAVLPRLEHHIRSGKPLEEFGVPGDNVTGHLWQFQEPLPPSQDRGVQNRRRVYSKLEQLAAAEKVDGEPVRNNAGQMPLVSMDVDLLTGLRLIPLPGESASELARMQQFMAKNGVTEFIDLIPKSMEVNIHVLPDEDKKERARAEICDAISGSMEKLKTKAQGDETLIGLLERAQKKLKIMLPRVYEASDKAFLSEKTGRIKPPARVSGQTPHLYVTQGGPGAGKSSFKPMVEKECGDTLVVATLDDVRDQSDRYFLYLALNNHNDDYKAIDQFGNAIRSLTTRRAREGGYNLLIDGSGIPYQNRNDKTVKAFKDDGYHVSVLAAHAPLFVHDPSQRQSLLEQEKLPDDVAHRIGQRLVSDLRGIMLDILVDKHTRFPIASRNAARDPNVDRFLIQDVSGEYGKSHALSYTVEVTEPVLQNLRGKTGSALKQEIVKQKLVPAWVTLPAGDGDAYGFKVIRQQQDGGYRIEIITDMPQYIHMVQQGLLNRQASGPEALFDNRLRCDIEHHFCGEGGRLKLQPPREVLIAPVHRFQPLSTQQNPVADPPLAR